MISVSAIGQTTQVSRGCEASPSRPDHRKHLRRDPDCATRPPRLRGPLGDCDEGEVPPRRRLPDDRRGDRRDA